MRQLRLLRHRVRSLFRRNAVEDELERELTLHLEQLAREQIAAGSTEHEARRAARRAFGARDLIEEQCRDTRRVGLLEDLVKDTRYALRLLGRSPGFALTAILSLALGIGANTAIFSLLDTVLLRSLPVARPQELVFISAAGSEGPSGAPPYPCFERLRNETTAFAGMAAFASDDLKVVVDGVVEQVSGQVASGNYFDLLGVRAEAGRLMTAADEKLDPPVAVISHAYAHQRFGGAASAIGRSIYFKDRAFTIVGVTPPGFWGLRPGRRVDLTLPITQEAEAIADPGDWWFEAVGRLRSDRSADEARSQADTVFQSFMSNRDRSGEMWKKYFDHIALTPASRGLDMLRRRFSKPLYALTAVATMVLLIACANIGSLLLVRGAARGREFAIRLATGAAGARLVRQLLTETLVIFVLGAIAGGFVAQLAVRTLTGFFTIGRSPILLDVRYDWRLAVFAIGLALVAAIGTGLWPAIQAQRTDPHSAIKDGDTRSAGSRRVGRATRLLVVGQVALSLVLLVGAVLFVKTMINLRSVDLGFNASGILTMSVDPVMPELKLGPTSDVKPELKFGPTDDKDRFWMELLRRVRELPGVRSASLSVLTPLSGRDTDRAVTIPGFRPRNDEEGLVHVNHVSEDYFRTFGIQLLAGRAFTADDNHRSLKVAIVSDGTARQYFGNRSPIGETLRFGASDTYQIVGVVRGFKHLSVRQPSPRFVFLPLWQRMDALGRTTLAIASDQPSATLLRAIAREVRTTHANTLISDVVGVRDQIDATLVSERLLSLLASAFAALALGLAAIGLYGVLSFSVARRRTEFGIRLALGSPRTRIAWDVVRSVLLQFVAGIAIGLPVALAGASAVGGLLFGVAPTASDIYLLSAGVLIAVAAMAAWLPAWRACSIEPSETLRCE